MKKTLVPPLRFPEFWDAPAWQENEMNQFLTESRVLGSKGNTAKKITVKLWGKGVFEKNDEVKGSVNTQYYRRTAGQFIYSKLDFLNQAFGIIPDCLDNYESTVDLPCFDMKPGINSLFLLEYVKRKDFYEKLGETADGSRKARRIHADTFLSFPIFMPQPSEQQKIADCLSSIDALISVQSQKVDALKTHKKGLMQQLFPREGETIPRLRFPEFLDAGEWGIEELSGKAIKVGSGITPAGGDTNYKAKGRPFVRSQNIGWGCLILENVAFIDDLTHSTFLASELMQNDVLLNITGASIGRSAVADKRIEGGNVNQHVCIVRTHESELNPFFLNQFLLSDGGQAQIDSFQAGGNRQGLNFAQIRSFSIPMPSTLSEQQKIADCLSSIDALISTHSQKLDTLKTHKKSLMQALFPVADEVGE
ncbi:restriction endonuclease subunit S [Massilia sp. PWRC2]|uniref:restriction endonuclease subunit S n=1 Tax=Massilia sp. PWRC2 TaxID=2804626 RepID=UPI003CE91E06